MSTQSLKTHPFYPIHLHIPHYLESELSMVQLLSIFFSGVAVIIGVSYYIIDKASNDANQGRQTRLKAKKLSPFHSLGAIDKSQFLWFVLCGFIHVFFEGYFVVNHKTIAGDSFLFADLWKEYAKSDSRYMTSDTFVVIMEAITAVLWGIGSFWLAYGIYQRKSWRWPLQFLVSVGQLYGDILYYGTTLTEGAPHCIPHPFYFYGYFIFLNFFWIVIPFLCIYQSWRISVSALDFYRDNHSKVGMKKSA